MLKVVPKANTPSKPAKARKKRNGDEISKCAVSIRFDRFEGPAHALVAAGLCTVDQLPGQPGVGKTMATIWPDGGRVLRSLGPRSARDQPGTRVIKKLNARGWFEIAVTVTREESERRKALAAAGQWWSTADQDRRERLGLDLYERTCKRLHLELVGTPAHTSRPGDSRAAFLLANDRDGVMAAGVVAEEFGRYTGLAELRDYP